MKWETLLKMGAFLISEGILIKGEWNEMFEERVAQEVLRHFCFNVSGRRKKFFVKIKLNHPNIMPLASSVSEATIWSITLELSIMILDASFSLIYNVYSTGITYDDWQLMIICL